MIAYKITINYDNGHNSVLRNMTVEDLDKTKEAINEISCKKIFINSVSDSGTDLRGTFIFLDSVLKISDISWELELKI